LTDITKKTAICYWNLSSFMII